VFYPVEPVKEHILILKAGVVSERGEGMGRGVGRMVVVTSTPLYFSNCWRLSIFETHSIQKDNRPHQTKSVVITREKEARLLANRSVPKTTRQMMKSRRKVATSSRTL
jgi:hypothetical protein